MPTSTRPITFPESFFPYRTCLLISAILAKTEKKLKTLEIDFENEMEGISTKSMNNKENIKRRKQNEKEDARSLLLGAYIHLFELLILLENILRQKLYLKKDIDVLKLYLPMFLDHYKRVVNRVHGMMMKFIKFHLPLHLADDILAYGPPEGWNGGPCETHHKTEVKDPARHTQRRADSFERLSKVCSFSSYPASVSSRVFFFFFFKVLILVVLEI